MRVIGGIYKHRHFDIPHTFKARPTTDFAKESLFDVLNNLIEWENTAALDLFAGTGSISIEMLSRECKRVISVEKDHQHAAFIHKIMETVKTDKHLLICGDVFKYLNSSHEKFDLIFADPPYDLPELDTLPVIVFGRNLLKPGGIFVLEHGKKNDFADAPHIIDQRKYGSVHFSIFKNEEE